MKQDQSEKSTETKRYLYDGIYSSVRKFKKI